MDKLKIAIGYIIAGVTFVTVLITVYLFIDNTMEFIQTGVIDWKQYTYIGMVTITLIPLMWVVNDINKAFTENKETLTRLLKER